MKNHVIEQVTRDILTFDMLRVNNIKQCTISIGPHEKIRVIIGGKLDPLLTPEHHVSLHPPMCIHVVFFVNYSITNTENVKHFTN